MYRQRDSFEAELGSGVAMMGIYIGIFLVLLVAFVIVVTVVFVVTTFVEHYKHRSLWIALAVFVVLCVAGLLWYYVYQPSLALVFVGIAELLITCLVVNLKNRDTLMREHVNLIDEVIHTPWWGSEDTPQHEKDNESIAA
jgi:hypothetical protein